MLAALLLLALAQTPDNTADAGTDTATPSEAAPPAIEPSEDAPPLAPAPLPPADAKVDGLDGVALKAAQLGACVGAWFVCGGISTALSLIPYVGGCVGCASCLVLSAVFGTTITAAGNYLGTKQAPLLWPIVTMYVGQLITGVAVAGTLVAAFIAVGASARTIASARPELLLGALFVPAVAAGAVGLVGAVATGVATTFVWDANAEPKTEPGQFQLAFTDMSQPFFGGKPKEEPKPAGGSGGQTASATRPQVALPSLAMAY